MTKPATIVAAVRPRHAIIQAIAGHGCRCAGAGRWPQPERSSQARRHCVQVLVRIAVVESDLEQMAS